MEHVNINLIVSAGQKIQNGIIGLILVPFALGVFIALNQPSYDPWGDRLEPGLSPGIYQFLGLSILVSMIVGVYFLFQAGTDLKNAKSQRD
jgi:hypothetical protein